jgi:hypothetical protein
MIEVFISRDGRLRFLPPSRVNSVNCEYSPEGGMVSASIGTSLTIGDLDTSLTLGDQVDVYHNSNHYWRGRVDDLQPNRDNTSSIVCYGEWVYAMRCTVHQKYLEPGGSDAAYWFDRVVRRWILPKFPTLTVRVKETGVLLEAFDLSGKPASDLVSRLREWSSNQICFGCKVVTDSWDDDYLRSCLYLGPSRSDIGTVHRYTFEDPRIGNIAKSTRSSTIVNAFLLIGGERDYPNLYPSDMETPRRSSTKENVLFNPGWESGGDHWTFHNGASLKPSGQAGKGPGIGGTMMETDNANEYAEQVVVHAGIIPGTVYEYGGLVRQTKPGSILESNRGYYELQFLDTDGNSVGTLNYFNVGPATNIFERLVRPVVAPIGATGYRFRCYMDIEAGDGLIWDQCELTNISSLYCEGMTLAKYGAASIIYQAPMWEVNDPYVGSGSYVYRFHCIAFDDDGEDCHLEPDGRTKWPVIPGQQYTFFCPVRRPAGAIASPKFKVDMLFYDTNGTQIAEYRNDVAAGVVGFDWTLLVNSQTAPAGAATACAWLVPRGECELEADAFCYRNSYPGLEWVPVGPYRTTFRAQDMTGIPGITADIVASESVYGWREPEQPVQMDNVRNDNDAQEFAVRYFQELATPVEAVQSLDIREPDGVIFPGDFLQLLGDGLTWLSAPQRVESSTLQHPTDGMTILRLSLGEPKLDPMQILLRRQSQARSLTQ